MFTFLRHRSGCYAKSSLCILMMSVSMTSWADPASSEKENSGIEKTQYGGSPAPASPAPASPAPASPAPASPASQERPPDEDFLQKALPGVDIIAGRPFNEHVDGCEIPELSPGHLSLNTSPWTRVELDGVPLGSTPLFQVRVLPGRHVLQLSNGAAGVDLERTIVVESQRTLKLNLFLSWSKDVERRQDLVLLDDGRGIKREDCGEDFQHPAFLSVQTNPWSKVFVDGDLIGSTPIFRHLVKPGAHVLRLENGQGAQTFSRFYVAEGEIVKVDLQD